VTGRYYFLDDAYRRNFRYCSANLDHLITSLASPIVNIEVYKSVPQQGNVNAVPGIAFFDPSERFDPTRNYGDPQHANAYFIRLEPGTDYIINRDHMTAVFIRCILPLTLPDRYQGLTSIS
jgi:hypothetical protein